MKCSTTVLGLLLAACSSAPPDDLSDGVCELPHELREVSAIAALPDGRLLCLQDEAGALFTFDPTARQPTTREVFGKRGDYEALAVVGDAYYVLRSDGWLARVQRTDGALGIVASVLLPGGHREWESLCHDVARGRLLAMPKVVAGDRKAEREVRQLYAIDPGTLVAVPEPVVVLDRRNLIEQAESRGIDLPTKATGKDKGRVVLELAITEITVVPGRSELLLLSAVDHLLLRVDLAGRLLAVARLDATLLPQPEGVAFFADGRLVVASEAAGGAARLCVVPVP